MTEDRILLGVIEINDAKRLRDDLLEQDVEVDVRYNKSTCQTGCRVTVEVWAMQSDLPTIEKTLEKNRMKLMDGLDTDPNLEGEVFDPEKGQATCPACGTTFATSEKECPDCGLVFIPEGLEEQ